MTEAIDQLPVEPSICLPPDDTDVRLVLQATLPRCPFCNGTPATFAWFFEHSGIFQSYVNCTWCTAQIFVNSRDREVAREKAIEKWCNRVAVRRSPAGDWNPRIGERVRVSEAQAEQFPDWRDVPLWVVGVTIERRPGGDAKPGLNVWVSEQWPVTSSTDGFTDGFLIGAAGEGDHLIPWPEQATENEA